MSKKDILVWKVYIHDINHRAIEEFNVFDHIGFRRDTIANLKKSHTKKDFWVFMAKDSIYYFSHRFEYELALGNWTELTTENYVRKDVHDQLTLNWNGFIDYLWNHRKEILKEELEEN